MIELSRREQEMVNEAIDKAIHQVKALNDKLGDKFPSPCTYDQGYKAIDNNYWTTSFYTGLQYLSYTVKEEEVFREKLEEHLTSFHDRLKRQIELDTHDLGFLYEYSSLMAYKCLGMKQAKEDALRAADLLMARYHKHAGIIQAWGDLTQSEHRGRMIIDANMNLPLLYFASEVTGHKGYYDAAYTHVKKAQTYIMREDHSTFHTYYFDPDSGKPLRGSTQQGFSDDSCWARGQAWAIYGFTLSYAYTEDETLLETAMEAADYFLDHLPKDGICFWDLVFKDGDEQERDSSSAAIAACGLIALAEAVQNIDHEKSVHYRTSAKQMVISLIETYTPDESHMSDALLLHSVYSKPHDKGVDEGSAWGDYYYMEALLRMNGAFKAFL